MIKYIFAYVSCFTFVNILSVEEQGGAQSAALRNHPYHAAQNVSQIPSERQYFSWYTACGATICALMVHDILWSSVSYMFKHNALHNGPHIFDVLHLHDKLEQHYSSYAWGGTSAFFVIGISSQACAKSMPSISWDVTLQKMLRTTLIVDGIAAAGLLVMSCLRYSPDDRVELIQVGRTVLPVLATLITSIALMAERFRMKKNCVKERASAVYGHPGL